jgi:hypothetical protein
MKNEHGIDPSEHFSSLLPEGQEWFSPKEAGNIIGRSDQFIRDSFSTGKIMGHTSNGIAPKGEEKKSYLRVHRDAIIMYLLESANYTPESFMESLESILVKRSDYQLLRLEKIIKDRLYSKKNRYLK